METDLERFVALYKSFGIDCVVSVDGEQKLIILNDWTDLENTSSDKFDGNSGCHSYVFFDLNGKFLRQDFYS